MFHPINGKPRSKKLLGIRFFFKADEDKLSTAISSLEMEDCGTCPSLHWVSTVEQLYDFL